MEKTHKKKRRLIDIMNPENLQKRISAYGYDFSLSNYLVSALISVIVAVAFGMLFALKPGYIAVIVLICIGLLPNVILNGYRNMYEHKRFADVSDYMEQILYSFKLNNKIVSALQDTQTMFTGQMYTAIQEALDYLDAGVSKTDLRREALQKIEAYYPLEQVRAIHAYMCTVERNGGNADSSVDLLLKDKNIWADNILLLQEEKKKSKMHISGAIFCTMAFAAVFHWVYRSMPEQYSILNHPITQIVTTLFIIADIFIWYKANKEVAKSWIEREADKKAERAVSYLKMIRAWDEKAERKKSFIIAVPFFVATIPLLVLGKVAFAVAVLVIGAAVLNQHKLGYKTAYRAVVKEINIAFPRWLMEVALLLQGNNVRNSIANSIETAPEILKDELKVMVEHMQREPASQVPYVNFLKEFQLSTVQSAMKMLYAISEMGSGEVETQVNTLVERNSKLLDNAEKMENEKKIAGMKGLFFLPQLTVSLQMLAMLALFSVIFLLNTSI